MKSKENDETGRKRRKIEKKIERQETLKLVERLRSDRPGKILAPEKHVDFLTGTAGPGR